MIARYDGRAGRWSATGVVLSLLLGGLTLTGAVRGQDATPAAAAPATPAAREVKAAPAVAPPSAASAAPAARHREDRDVAADVLDEDVDVALIAQLDRKLPEVSFDGAGFSDVIDFLRDVSGANIVVEWGPLTSAGLDRNTPVSLRVKNVKFGRTLDLILSSAGGGSVPLGYTIQENIIRISTREHLDSLTDVRAYDVRDIVPAEVQVGDLTRLIKESVAPDSWGENGGAAGSILATKHKIVVRQTPMNHREVRNLLQRLREDPGRTPQATDAASAAQATPASPGRQ